MAGRLNSGSCIKEIVNGGFGWFGLGIGAPDDVAVAGVDGSLRSPFAKVVALTCKLLLIAIVMDLSLIETGSTIEEYFLNIKVYAKSNWSCRACSSAAAAHRYIVMVSTVRLKVTHAAHQGGICCRYFAPPQCSVVHEEALAPRG